MVAAWSNMVTHGTSHMVTYSLYIITHGHMVPTWSLHSHTWSLHGLHLVRDPSHIVGNNIKAFDLSDFYYVESPISNTGRCVLNLTTFFMVVTTVKDRRLFLLSFYTFPQLLTAVIGVVNGC